VCSGASLAPNSEHYAERRSALPNRKTDMAGRERDWMDYAMLGSSLAQNSQLSSIGDQLAALKQAESQKQFAEFEVTVLRQILFRIEDRIRYFAKQASYSPQGRMLGLMKVTEVLAAFRDPSLYRNYEDKDRHTALNAKVDEAVLEVARSLPPAELAEFNEAVAWQRTKLQLLARAMQLNRDGEAYLKATADRPRLEGEYLERKAAWQAARDTLNPQLLPLEEALKAAEADTPKLGNPQGCVIGLLCSAAVFSGLLALSLFMILDSPKETRGEKIFDSVLLLLFLISSALASWLVSRTQRKNQAVLEGKIALLKSSVTPEPSLPPPPTKPTDEHSEKFLSEEHLGSTFEELETVFADKRALVERVLEADAALCKELDELVARDLLQSTAHAVAAKMGLPLPPQLAIGATG